MTYNKEYHRAYYLKNRDKKRAYTKAYKERHKERLAAEREANKDKETDKRLRKVFGISIRDYEKMLKRQGGVCAICRREEKNKRLAVDHCHTTGVVRGLLCQKCNWAIGMFEDDIQRMEAAINYIESCFKKRQQPGE